MVFLLAGFTAAHAVNVSLGVNAWYLWWLPNFEDNFRGDGNAITAADPANYSQAYGDTWTLDPGFMVGPVLTLQISEQWSLGLIALFSQEFTVESSYKIDAPIYAYTNTARHTLNIRRYDGDLTVNYRISPGLGLFGGFKYLQWDGSGTYDITTIPNVYTAHTDHTTEGRQTGPALGLSFAHPLAGTLFFTASASGLLMRTREENRVVTTDTTPSYSDVTTKKKYWSRGFNGMAGLGYHIASMRSTLLIGWRYQYLRNEDVPRDIFYGVTATAMYTF